MDYTIAVGGSRGELFIWQLEENPNFCERYGLTFEGNRVNFFYFLNFFNFLKDDVKFKNASKKKKADAKKRAKKN